MADTTPHISYAMRNAEATHRLISFNAPSRLFDWSHLAIEALVILGAALALTHAVRHARRTGSPSAVYTFAAIFLYGLVMDISSYYTVESFWHGEFSVMLLYNRLPLYITAVYPALMYHGYMTIRRYAFSPVTEALSVAFYSGVLYMIFDNLGPALNWWIWDRKSAFNQPFVSSVPLTSYHWFFLFTGALAFWIRTFCWDAVAQGKMGKARVGTASIPVLTILLGALLFVPYNVFMFALPRFLGVAALLHAVVFFGAGYWFLLRYRRQDEARDPLLLFFPMAWVFGQLFIYVAHADLMWSPTHDGLNEKGLAVGNIFAAVSAMVVGVALTLASHLPGEKSAFRK